MGPAKYVPTFFKNLRVIAPLSSETSSAAPGGASEAENLKSSGAASESAEGVPLVVISAVDHLESSKDTSSGTAKDVSLAGPSEVLRDKGPEYSGNARPELSDVARGKRPEYSADAFPGSTKGAPSERSEVSRQKRPALPRAAPSALPPVGVSEANRPTASVAPPLESTTRTAPIQLTEVANAVHPAAERLEHLIRRLGGTATQRIGPVRYGDLQLFAEELQYGVGRMNIRKLASKTPKEDDSVAQPTSEDIGDRLTRVISNARRIPSSWKDKLMSEKVEPPEEVLEVLYRAKSIIAETERCAESLMFLRKSMKMGEKKQQEALQIDLKILTDWSSSLVKHLQAILAGLEATP